jgi:hypothetical protein
LGFTLLLLLLFGCGSVFGRHVAVGCGRRWLLRRFVLWRRSSSVRVPRVAECVGSSSFLLLPTGGRHGWKGFGGLLQRLTGVCIFGRCARWGYVGSLRSRSVLGSMHGFFGGDGVRFWWQFCWLYWWLCSVCFFFFFFC